MTENILYCVKAIDHYPFWVTRSETNHVLRKNVHIAFQIGNEFHLSQFKPMRSFVS